MIMQNNLRYPYSPRSEGGLSNSPDTKLSRLSMADETDNGGRGGRDGNDVSIPPQSNRIPHSSRRNRVPPRNELNQIFCNHVNCRGLNLTFKRNCEWNKHMDRHERPYKCHEAGCELNAGFTYSGGLLRHQREVHKMHLSTREPLFCPFPNCNRSSGSGFTRKENLEEHKRRRHLEEMSHPSEERGADRAKSQVPATSTSTMPTPTNPQPVGSPGKRKRVDEAVEDTFRRPSLELESRRLAPPQAAASSSKTILSGTTEADPPTPHEREIHWLRTELRTKDDLIMRQAAELHRLQNLLRALPPQTVYGVMAQPRMPATIQIAGRPGSSTGADSGGGG